MEPVNFDAFQTEITYFFEYYQRPLSGFVLDIWYNFLAKYLTDEEIKSAIAKAIAEKKELPTPEELVESIKGSGFFLLLHLKQQQEAEARST